MNRRIVPSLTSVLSWHPQFAPYAHCLRLLRGDRRAEKLWLDLVDLHLEQASASDEPRETWLKGAVIGAIQWLVDGLVAIGACGDMLPPNREP